MAPQRTPSGAEPLLPAVLSTTAGAVDVIGFLTLGGLFAAHITGNLVLVAVYYVTGNFSRLGPLLAIPVFVAALAAATLATMAAEKAGYSPRRWLLALQAALLTACLVLAVWLGPFSRPDLPTVVVGMLAIWAMAMQNALLKLALPGVPSTVAMTGNITQLTVDLVRLARGQGDTDELAKVRHRVALTWPCVVGFIAGCVAGAALESRFGVWAFALPVALAVLAVPLGEMRTRGATEPV